ncbi:glycosyltransferase [Humibacter sp. BT305]|nr:glycosyltransferase [Humibacter sp. BT305]
MRSELGRIAAIVVNWRAADLTSRAVASLEAQTDLDGRSLEVVIVDNGSGDGSATVLADRHPLHRLVALERNGGFGAGVNAGVRAVDADVYVLLNNDAVAAPGFVHALVGALESAPRAGAVSARILLRDRYARVSDGASVGGALSAADGTSWAPSFAGHRLVNSTGNEMTSSGNGRDRDWLVPADDLTRPAGEVAGFSGGASALRATALSSVGLFDETLFMYYEDTELSWRLRAAGWSILYEPAAEAVHLHAASTGTASDSFLYYNERNRLIVSTRIAPPAVAARAWLRSMGAVPKGLLRRDGGAARRVRALGAAARVLPATLRSRRALSSKAVVPRRDLARWIAG